MKPFPLLGLTLLCSLGSSLALDPGAPAPQVSALDENGAKIEFADLYKKGPTLVYFYPKADTPGCTTQACSLRDSYEGLQVRGLQIVGVSGDQPADQKKFKEKYMLPFPLVADTEGKVAQAFEVPTSGSSKRQSFLINGDKVVWIDPKVSPADHVAKVNAALDAIQP